MSEKIINTISNAVNFNSRNIPKFFGGQRSLPVKFKGSSATKDLNHLFERDCGSDAFARHVVILQEKLGFSKGECDAKFGRGTLRALLRSVDRIEDNYVTLEGVRYKINPHGWEMLSFDQKGGLDLHRRGHFSTRTSEITTVCYHWGGLNPYHFYNVAMSPTRRISSHFGIGKNKKGIVQVFQFLDMSHRAWHCGKANDQTIGIDICQQADAKWFSHYEKAGVYRIERMENPSSRGPSRVLSLDTEILWAVKDFSQQLEVILSDNLASYKGGRPVPHQDEIINLRDVDNYRAVGHHHLRSSKWDIAPWWDTVFGDDE